MDILYSSLDAILLIDMEHFVDCNEATARMLGYSDKNKLLQTHPAALSPPTQPDGRSSLEKANEMMKVAFYRGSNQFEWVHRRANGEDLPVEVSLTSIVFHRKNLLYCVWRDLTERKKAENELRDSTCKLNDARDMLIQSEKLAAIGTLAAGVTHEILNPLNIISLNLQVLTTAEVPSEKMKQMLVICEEQVERIVKISKDLNQFARIESQEIVLGNINNLIEQTFNLITPKLRIKKVSTDLQLRSDLPAIPLDKSRLGQVFLNLVNNAIDAMDTVEEKFLLVSTALVTSADGEFVQVVIADRGTGIPEENKQKIFDPFFTTKEPGKGTGLGLSITYRIIQSHSGRIWAANNEWGGASFFIELPVRTPSGTACAMPQANRVFREDKI